MLQYEPSQRISAAEAMKHEFFADLSVPRSGGVEKPLASMSSLATALGKRKDGGGRGGGGGGGGGDTDMTGEGKVA